MLKNYKYMCTSELSYENAISKVINELISQNYKIHNFVIIEQKGVIIDERIQYQAVIQIVLDESNKIEPHKATELEHDIACDWCGCVMHIKPEFSINNTSNSLVCNCCGRIMSVSDKSFKTKLK
ncbi:MAG TPA: hypothetical protein PL063_01505 [Candidatus Cloacimonadota bacterium]|nr:hypothetical protein [Candidatus Cloacimonadota bacterium]HPY95869.1 hypothetical protein [Candidatus Cloacimonadota bacterium]HQB41036.1 hypothetical protein [Candidatus Cloacimonadota bacterium]